MLHFIKNILSDCLPGLHFYITFTINQGWRLGKILGPIAGAFQLKSAAGRTYVSRVLRWAAWRSKIWGVL